MSRPKLLLFDTGCIFEVMRQGLCLIEEYIADASDIRETLQRWPGPIRDRADPGELEALTYLRLMGSDDTAFLTADGPAIQAAVAFQCGDSAMSLDLLFSLSGCTRDDLDRKFRDDFVDDHKRRGLDLLLDSLVPKTAPLRKPRKR